MDKPLKMCDHPSVDCFHSPSPSATSSSQELYRDQLWGLLRTEPAYVVDYIPCNGLVLANEERTPLDEWRRKICQWSFRVIDHFRLDREVVSVGMNILDRFLVAYQPKGESNKKASCPCPACKRSVDGEMYQLAAMTCIYLAIKLHVDNGSDDEYSRRKHFKLSTFAELSRGLFSADDIINMERVVLETVGWKLSTPTPMTFVNYFLTLMPDRSTVPVGARSRYDLVIHVARELSRYLTELAVSLGTDCMYYPPSQVAFAATLVSMDLLTYQALPQSVRDIFSDRISHMCRWTWESPEAIYELQERLKRSLWPDMLLDDSEPSDSGHPISMARECGILNVANIYHATPCVAGSSPATPPRKIVSPVNQSWEGSPVSVDR